MNLPPHTCGLQLEHNPHRNLYQTVEEWLKCEHEIYDWRDDESRVRAIATGEIWTLLWYPITPVSFHALAAPTLDELLEWANEFEV